MGTDETVRAGQEWSAASVAYVTPGSGDAWAMEAERQGRRGTQQLVSVSEAVPSEAVVAALNLAAGATVIVRRRVMHLDGRPVELTDSYYPASIALGTQLAEQRKIRGGAVTLLSQLGWPIASTTETVVVDLPDAEVRQALQLDNGESVMVLTRTSRTAGGEPVELSIMTMPRGACLRYEMKVG